MACTSNSRSDPPTVASTLRFGWGVGSRSLGMSDWFDRLWDLLAGKTASPSRLFRRNISLSAPAQEWFNDSTRTDAQRAALAEALLKLDSNPVGEMTAALLGPGRPLGLRSIGGHGLTVIYLWDPGRDAIKVLKCVHAHATP